MKAGNATNSCPCRSGSWPTMCVSQIPDLSKEHSFIDTAVFYTSAIYHSSNNTKTRQYNITYIGIYTDIHDTLNLCERPRLQRCGVPRVVLCSTSPHALPWKEEILQEDLVNLVYTGTPIQIAVSKKKIARELQGYYLNGCLMQNATFAVCLPIRSPLLLKQIPQETGLGTSPRLACL